jgi:dTMP kinase
MKTKEQPIGDFVACPRNKALFFSFEGTEGAGKTTQMRILIERLRGLGYVVTQNQEPGATRIGGQIRRLLLDPEHQEMTAITELLLLFASRAQAAAEIIGPALERGEIVVSDRFTDSSLAYQGEARQLGFETVLALHRLALGALLPDLTLCISLDVATGLDRAYRRSLSSDRLDRQSLGFHESVDRAYRKIAELEPERFRLIDGGDSPEIVAARVWSQVEPLLK